MIDNEIFKHDKSILLGGNDRPTIGSVIGLLEKNHVAHQELLRINVSLHGHEIDTHVMFGPLKLIINGWEMFGCHGCATARIMDFLSALNNVGMGYSQGIGVGSSGYNMDSKLELTIIGLNSNEWLLDTMKVELVTGEITHEINEFFEKMHGLSGTERFEMINKDNAMIIFIPKYGMSIIDILMDSKSCESTSEARRLIKQNAISLDGIKIEDKDFVVIPMDNEQVLKVGKKKYVKINRRVE